jgi:hypothetical protein
MYATTASPLAWLVSWLAVQHNFKPHRDSAVSTRGARRVHGDVVNSRLLRNLFGLRAASVG